MITANADIGVMCVGLIRRECKDHDHCQCESLPHVRTRDTQHAAVCQQSQAHPQQGCHQPGHQWRCGNAAKGGPASPQVAFGSHVLTHINQDTGINTLFSISQRFVCLTIALLHRAMSLVHKDCFQSEESDHAGLLHDQPVVDRSEVCMNDDYRHLHDDYCTYE